MKFVTTWKVRPGKLSEAANRFLTTGDPKPDGIRCLGRWFRSDMLGGFHLVEADSAAALAQYSARWADLLEIETSAVIEDAEAVSVMGEIAGMNVQAGVAATSAR